jgi:preprotein translocase subunit SecE
MEKVRFVLAVVLVATGIAGFYLLGDKPAIVRLLSVLGGMALALAAVWTTQAGRDGREYVKEAIAEAHRVVWPTRKETIQMTGVVFALVVVMAIFMWVVDSSLLWVVKLVMGRAG